MTTPASFNPVGRFSNRADDYARFRPTYPAAAIDAVLESLGDHARLAIADVGAGTGISSRLLAGRGPRVIAIEPNAAMRAAAEPHPRVQWREGTGESTGLPAASVNLVTAFQSFHWFDPPAALAEFRRILTPRGRIALAWNDGDQSDPATAAYYAIVMRYWNGPRAVMLETNPLEGHAGLANIRRLTFRNEQPLDLDGLLGRALSASYVPKEGPESQRVLDELATVHAKHAGPRGTISLVYKTEVFMAEAA